ncbi:proteasome ATPase [Dermacoccus nishinomiyaensis]|uniref:proteasome ATPase n=1 Tax=Dermacoccus TaxID=57495 RepID=UPI0001E642A6|nr:MULTISPECIES: proteasome ATPase [Dermacoccus]EFP56837.1 proteasome ATPase [Dermacoccus sp. Ellin185]MBO1757195.1 proteasome ATPase [Dermacoccus sp. NHGro5]QQY23567.1 proteasome ATPase [Dermacoccus nishinomiyaensis]TCJ91670.1 proteasome-associated ATPase [Dermacoccus sp. SAI-028]STD15144.1 Mycobacterial proteasome ATPase [Dermacoccus nishinomiyaensis]
MSGPKFDPTDRTSSSNDTSSGATSPADVLRLRSQLTTVSSQNERLVRTLKDARDQIASMKGEIERLAQPPNNYATVIAAHDDGSADIFYMGRKMLVSFSPAITIEELVPGQEVMVNEAMNIVRVVGFERAGETVTLKETLEDGRLLVATGNDEERVVRTAGPLADVTVRPGDTLLMEAKSGFVLERLTRAEVSDLGLEEVPDIDYSDIGGLAGQIETIRDSVELPFLHADLYAEHHLRPPKGVLLYGPPGCGKTLVAKAVAASLAKQVAAKQGNSDATSYFLNIKGPELLNKYVGETERHIRVLFQRAREVASSGTPVVVFFDEMESLFRIRGAGVSSDVETTIVPQLLAEIDGVESLENVIVIGASNREDMIDPAVLRPGRLDVKIRIERPDEVAGRDIFGKYLTPALPFHADEIAAHDGDPSKVAASLIDIAAGELYARDDAHAYLEATYADGSREVLYFADFASGAMIQNIVDRAKKAAIKALITSEERGIRAEHVRQACRDEFRENEDLPGTSNPDDWARVSGRRGERIVNIRTLADKN